MAGDQQGRHHPGGGADGQQEEEQGDHAGQVELADQVQMGEEAQGNPGQLIVEGSILVLGEAQTYGLIRQQIWLGQVPVEVIGRHGGSGFPGKGNIPIRRADGGGVCVGQEPGRLEMGRLVIVLPRGQGVQIDAALDQGDQQHRGHLPPIHHCVGIWGLFAPRSLTETGQQIRPVAPQRYAGLNQKQDQQDCPQQHAPPGFLAQEADRHLAQDKEHHAQAQERLGAAHIHRLTRWLWPGVCRWI